MARWPDRTDGLPAEQAERSPMSNPQLYLFDQNHIHLGSSLNSIKPANPPPLADGALHDWRLSDPNETDIQQHTDSVGLNTY